MSNHLDPESFAQRLMNKQGWTDGQGLGAKGQGIVDAIKPQLKFDVSGVGHDQAKEFTDHWWDHAFNKTAKSIQVSQGNDGEAVVETKKIKSKKEIAKEKRLKKNSLYSQFVKSATLEGGKIIEESKSDNEEDENVKFAKLSDEELYKACGGLTAHKGARHGHKMTAKQKRIEEMEAKLIADLELKKKDDKSDKIKKKKKKKKKSE